MIRIAVCDDSNDIVNQIERYILGVCTNENIPVDIDAFYCGETLEKEIMTGTKYDILYLDIEMKNKDGITAANNIRKIDENVIIIYVSGFDKYMIQLFRLDVFAFIKKPIEQKIFERIFLEAIIKICNNQNRYKSIEYKFLCKDIMYFESSGRQINIYLKSGEVGLFNEKLDEVENRLINGKIPFLRIHQSYLINYHLIKSRSKTKVIMINNKILSISEERQKNFNINYGRLLGGEIDE